jgi:hypothetical protein
MGDLEFVGERRYRLKDAFFKGNYAISYRGSDDKGTAVLPLAPQLRYRSMARHALLASWGQPT